MTDQAVAGLESRKAAAEAFVLVNVVFDPGHIRVWRQFDANRTSSTHLGGK